MDAIKMDRRFDLDWLRVGAIGIVFLYHSTRFFNLEDWHIKNIDTFVWVELWNIFATRWMMPLFFIISGASLFYALGKAGGWSKFYTDKLLRLLVPVLVASVTHSALQIYLERLTHGHFVGSFFAFLPEYFHGLYLSIGMPGNFAFHGMHLWYLLFLFLYSLLCYPLFIRWKGNGQASLKRITDLLAAPGLMIVWFVLPLILMKALLPAAILKVGSGGWGFLYYIWFLIAGFMIVASDRLQQAIKKQRWLFFILGLLLSAVHLYLRFGPAQWVNSDPAADWVRRWLPSLLTYFCAWSWLFAILGFGMRLQKMRHPLLRHANEGVLPFFILHQTVLLAVGYFVMPLEMHALLKWTITVIGSLLIIFTLYVPFIRRVELLRFLFGMKTRHSFFNLFRQRSILLILPLIFVGLMAVTVVNQVRAAERNRSPVPMAYNPGQDVILNYESIAVRSKTGVEVVDDAEASTGRAMAFVSGASKTAKARPEVYIDLRFSAPAGRYHVWLRGKSNLNDGLTDSVWVQVDDQIGNPWKSICMGNWLVHRQAGEYAWAGNSTTPVAFELKHDGEHKIRLQPRQTPHRIDQVWLSREQQRIPDTDSALN